MRLIKQIARGCKKKFLQPRIFVAQYEKELTRYESRSKEISMQEGKVGTEKPVSPCSVAQCDGYVYYCSDGNGRVKIGWSKNPWSRISEQLTWCPEAKLLAIEKAPQNFERIRHKDFKEDHLALEWYRHSKRLETHIKSLRKSIPFKGMAV